MGKGSATNSNDVFVDLGAFPRPQGVPIGALGTFLFMSSPQNVEVGGYLTSVPGTEFTVVSIEKTSTGGFDPVLRIYSTPYLGAVTPNLYASANLTLVARDDDSYDSLGNSIIRFTPAANTTYVAFLTPFSESDFRSAYPTGEADTFLEVSYDSVGNSIGSALSIGTLSNSGYTFNDFVGYGDKEDYYQFSLAAPTTITASISGMSGDADIRLLNSSGTELGS
jgi:hypothetical protein